MKILLVAINAKYIHSNPAVFSLRASCKAYQSSVEIAEYTINQQPGYILSDIYQRKPDVVEQTLSASPAISGIAGSSLSSSPISNRFCRMRICGQGVRKSPMMPKRHCASYRFGV